MSANCQASYDAVAEEYAARIFDELRHKPLDRELLNRFAASVRVMGPVCDLGCGPGQIEREPYPEVEHQSRRAYIFARKLT